MSLVPFLADMTMSSGGLGQGLIMLVVAVIVISFIWWANSTYVPEPVRKYVLLVVVLLCVLFLCNFIMSFNGNAFIHW